MAGDTVDTSKPVLDPITRISEVLFGIIMTLTVTGSLSVAEAGHADIRTMLAAALGCNLAWGAIDGVLYFMANMAERGKGRLMLQAVRNEADPERARQAIANALPSTVAPFLRTEELESVRQRVMALPGLPDRVRLHKDDWRGAVAVFFLVVLCTFPMVVPFVFMQNVQMALRVSNVIAIVMLFITGYAFGRITTRPLAKGLTMVVLGIVLVGIAILLGG